MLPLNRFFAGSPIFGAFILLAAVVWAIQIILSSQFYHHRAEAHGAVAQSLATLLWQQHGDLVAALAEGPRQALVSRPEQIALARLLARISPAFGDAVVRIYGPGGVLVYAGDGARLGEDLSAAPGFVRASGGHVYTDSLKPAALASTAVDVAAGERLATFVPLRSGADAALVAVIEVRAHIPASTGASHLHSYSKFALVALLLLVLWRLYKGAPGGTWSRVSQLSCAQRLPDEQLCYPAYLDPVTGLVNRAGFRDRLTEAFARARRFGRPLALLHLDLDRFKLVNDSLGHDAGDEALRAAGARLLDAVRETDLVFRVGGDEFAVLVEELERVEDVVIVADRIVTAMARPMQVSGRDVYVTASVGMAIYPRDSGDMDTLVAQASAATARASKEGSSRYRFFEDNMNIGAIQHLELETALQTALENQEFELYYQIKVSASRASTAGIEALLRWRRPGYGMVPPSEFIANLERSGLIVPVGQWVMSTAAEQVCRWMAQGMAPLRVSVNISAVQFHAAGFVETVREVLANTGLPPRLLELELTETLLVEHTEHAIDVMNQLKALGVTLSIDDFGVGYSSLSYLKRFPVDYLKVDRSFVLDLLENRKDAAITTAIASLARSLEIGLVAEGVESRAQAQWLIAQGYDELQGFLYSRPLPPLECARLIHDIEHAHQKLAHLA